MFSSTGSGLKAACIPILKKNPGALWGEIANVEIAAISEALMQNRALG